MCNEPEAEGSLIELKASLENVRSVPGWWAALTLFLVLSALVATRVWLVDQKIGSYIGCGGCFSWHVIFDDLLVICALASLLLLASATPTRLLARMPLFLCALLILAYATDLVVFRLFNTRLLMTDVTLFLFEIPAVWDQFSTGIGNPLVTSLIIAGIILLLVLVLWMPAVRSRSFRLTMSFVMGLSLVGNALFEPEPYVNDWAVENIFVANKSTTSKLRYSTDVETELLASSVPLTLWSSGAAVAAGRNVLMVIIESWSPWHSRLWGGYENWTPALDHAAGRGVRFDNFHSIGFSTNQGLVGILAGQQTWAPFLHWLETPPFHSMWGVQDGLAQAFNHHDYHTAFLTSGPLSLNSKGDWMNDLGFDEVEDNENPFYEDLPKFSFGSAADAALYQRALEWMAQAPEIHLDPWFLVLETVSTHQPYKDPDSGKRSLELAMKYADREFGKFLDELDQSRFFDNGVLIVVSDHRSMTPMSSEELDLWGEAAHSRVPAFMIGNDIRPGSIDEATYSQSDLTPSFEWWLEGEVALAPFEAVMFDPEFVTRKCAFFLRMDRRAMVDANCDEGYGQIMLHGDDTPVHATQQPQYRNAIPGPRNHRPIAPGRLAAPPGHRYPMIVCKTKAGRARYVPFKTRINTSL